MGLLLTACGPRVVTQVAPGNIPRAVNTIAVYPFSVQFSGTPGLSYEKTVDLVNAALEARRYDVYSYGDFQLFTQDTVGLYEGRTLLSVIKEENIPLESLALLRGGVMLEDPARTLAPRRDETQRVIRGKLPVLIYVELYHYERQERLARAETRVVLDPLQSDQGDPFPLLTKTVRQLAQTTLALAEKRAVVPAARAPFPISYYADHSLLFRIATDDAPSIARFMLSQDEVEEDTSWMKGYQYFYPEISLLEVQRLNMTPGILVRSVDAPWLLEQGLQVGDILTSLNGKSLRAAHQLDRLTARLESGDQLTFELVRKGKKEVITVTSP